MGKLKTNVEFELQGKFFYKGTKSVSTKLSKIVAIDSDTNFFSIHSSDIWKPYRIIVVSPIFTKELIEHIIMYHGQRVNGFIGKSFITNLGEPLDPEQILKISTPFISCIELENPLQFFKTGDSVQTLFDKDIVKLQKISRSRK